MLLEISSVLDGVAAFVGHREHLGVMGFLRFEEALVDENRPLFEKPFLGDVALFIRRLRPDVPSAIGEKGHRGDLEAWRDERPLIFVAELIEKKIGVERHGLLKPFGEVAGVDRVRHLLKFASAVDVLR